MNKSVYGKESVLPGIPSKVHSASRNLHIPITARAAFIGKDDAHHWHEFIQIWYCVSGSYHHTVGGKRTLQTPGSVVFVFPFSPHSIDTSESPSDTRLIYMDIPTSTFSKCGIPFYPTTHSMVFLDDFHFPSIIKFVGEEKDKVDAIAEALVSEYNKKFAMILSRMYSHFSSFMELCAKHASKKSFDINIADAYEENCYIANAVSYMVQNYNSDISIEKVSSIAMMSRASFSKKFPVVTGRGYHDYLLRIKLQNAINLLRCTSKSVSEIAGICGFSSHSHLSRVCADITGFSPIALRKNIKQYLKDYGDIDLQATLQNAWMHNRNDELMEEMLRISRGDHL